MGAGLIPSTGALLKPYLSTKFDSSTDIEDYLWKHNTISTFLQQKKFKELHLEVDKIYFSLSSINLFLGQSVCL